MKKQTIFFVAVAIIIVLAVLFYLNQNKTEPITISATDVAPVHFLFQVIQDNNLDKQNGLDFKLIWSQPGEVERKLRENIDGVEIGFYGLLPLVQADEAGSDLRIISTALSVPPVFVVGSGSSYKIVADLKGLRLAVRPKASADFSSLTIAMRVAGLDLQKDFRLTFASVPDSIKLLTSGAADATVLPIPNAVTLVAGGKYRFISDLNDQWIKAADGPLPFVDFAAHGSWIAANPKKLSKFDKVMADAVMFIQNNPNAISKYKDLLGIRNDAALSAMERYLPSSYVAGKNFSSHEFLLSKALEFGILKELPKKNIFIR